MRLAPYYAYVSTAATATLVGLSTVPLYAGRSSSLASAAFVTSGLHWVIVGVLVAGDWWGWQRQLRAIQRIKRRHHGPVVRWVCRDTRPYWIANAVGLVVCGVALIASGVAFAFLD